MLLSLANGMSATLYCSLITAPTYRFAIYGTKGWVELASRTPTPVPRRRPNRRRSAAIPRRRPKSSITRDSTRSLPNFEGFAAAINGQRPYPINADEILHGVAAFEAIVHSAASHRPVKVAR